MSDARPPPIPPPPVPPLHGPENCEDPSCKKHSKAKSSKLWVTIWSMALATFIVVLDRQQFNNIAQWLCMVPLGYIGANVWQKKIYEGHK